MPPNKTPAPMSKFATLKEKPQRATYLKYRNKIKPSKPAINLYYNE